VGEEDLSGRACKPGADASDKQRTTKREEAGAALRFFPFAAEIRPKQAGLLIV